MAKGDFLRNLFPFISMAAHVVGGPLGDSASTMLGKALGVDKANPSADELTTAYVNATPEQRAAAAQIENDFKARMAELGFKNAEQMAGMAYADTASARAREIALKDKVPAILAFGFTAGFFFALYAVMKWGIPESSHDLVMVMLGSLGTSVSVVVGYYFGSSKSSEAKSETIAGLAKNGVPK